VPCAITSGTSSGSSSTTNPGFGVPSATGAANGFGNSTSKQFGGQVTAGAAGVAILSAFALVAPAQASTKVRGDVAEEKKSRRSRTLKAAALKGMGMKGLKGMKGTKAKVADMEEEDEEELDVYFSLISAAQEVAGCMSQASGNALATLNPTSCELCIKLSYSGLSGPELLSHIHGPAKIGEHAGVLSPLSLDPVKTDCFTLDSEQIKYLEAGHLYFKIHSEMCPSGEIRGQILGM
jgi:hypothetical protein